MSNSEIARVHERLWSWCREQEFAGWDPFDGLNSKLFQLTPFRHSRAFRLVWTQAFKRSPINFRGLALVPPQQNPKGIALFALAALADHRRLGTSESEANARALLENLITLRLTSNSGAACWGYNFDWQGRAFFSPRGTPTVVPTAFAVRALVEATAALNDESYLRLARSACDFVLADLNRTEETNDEVCFSYSPIDRTRVFNASLLASESLAQVGKATRDENLLSWAQRATRYVLSRQQDDGSWSYGAEGYQTWADSFHSAFVLTSLSLIIQSFPDNSTSLDGSPRTLSKDHEFIAEAQSALRRGYEFWRERFFLANGWPKYYVDRLYPADAHAAGAALVALAELSCIDGTALDLAETIARWAIDNLYDKRGFFNYQRRRFLTVRTPYMRWSEAWMLYGASRFAELKIQNEKCKNQEEHGT